MQTFIGQGLVCPYCGLTICDMSTTREEIHDMAGFWVLETQKCPACSGVIIVLSEAVGIQGDYGEIEHCEKAGPSHLIWPRRSLRPRCPAEVMDTLATDYHEACLVVGDSPKASAALSRRCLQMLLRESAGVKPGNLADEIEQVLQSRTLPSRLAEAVDAIRNIGNFAAHPTKSRQTGEVVEVEPGEAEWNLDVLELLFDFYYVQPAALQRRKDGLNQKLQDAGKPPMK